MNINQIGFIDKLAVSSSTICAIHCIALPFLVSVFPAIGATVFGGEEFHILMLWAVIPASLIGLSLGCNKHRNFSILSLGFIGVAILVFAAFFGHDLFGDIGERGVTLLGAVMIAIAHIRNFKICRSVACSH